MSLVRVKWYIYIFALVVSCCAFLLSSRFMHKFFRSDTYWDDAFLAAIVLSIGIAFVHQRELRKAEIERQRLRTFRATMVTIHDLMGNFLSNLQFIQSESFCMPEELRKLFDQMLFDVAAHLKVLSNLEVLQEKPMAIGTGIDYPLPLSKDANAAAHVPGIYIIKNAPDCPADPLGPKSEGLSGNSRSQGGWANSRMTT
jgi:hypothetical protein